MLSHFGRALRALAMTAALSAAIASAHEGHDHEQQPPVSAGALPRGEADSNAFEIVAIARGENLEIYLDRFATNEPVIGATLEVESPGGPVKAAAGADGTYRVAAPWLAKGGRTDLIFTVTAGDTTDILPLTIQAASGAAQNAAPRDSTSGGHISMASVLLVLGGVLMGALLSAIALRGGRRAAALAVMLPVLMGAGVPATHEGHGHEEEKAQIAISTVSASAPSACRMGRFLCPRQCSGYLRCGRWSPKTPSTRRSLNFPGGSSPILMPADMCNPRSAAGFLRHRAAFPDRYTGKQGDILGYVTPPIEAIDVSDMRQRQGELDQQISIVERRFARYEQLAPSGAISRTQLEDTRLELEGLRDRRASIEKSRREPEALIAPVAGVIAEGSAVAGQIVQPSSVVFNIIDPSRLWVEALNFESLEPSRGARARHIRAGITTLSIKAPASPIAANQCRCILP